MKLNPLKPTWKISEKLILENFKFLQSEFDFPRFKKKWIRDEYYITTRKNGIEFSCLIFELSSTSPLIGIINYSKTLESNVRPKKPDFYKIDSLAKTGKLKKIAEMGREYIETYIENCAEILREKPSILKGNINEFETEYNMVYKNMIETRFIFTIIFITIHFLSYSQSRDSMGREYFESKNVGSAKKIGNGNIYILSIFASYGDSEWLADNKKHFISKEKTAYDWITKEAKKYGKEFNYKQGVYYYEDIDFKLKSNLLVNSKDLITSVRTNVNLEVLRALISQGFKNTNHFIDYIKTKYKCSQVLVNLYVKGKGQSFANTYFNTSVASKYLETVLIAEKNKWDVETYSSSIAHETLHLFGGWDLYAVVSNDKEREKLAKVKYPASIFLNTKKDINQHIIDEITAWRIGFIGRKERYLNFIPSHYYLN